MIVVDVLKKCDTPAQLLFCLSNPIACLLLSLPSSLLKLPNVMFVILSPALSCIFFSQSELNKFDFK